MPSFANIRSFFLLFILILSVASLAASAPIPPYHAHHHLDSPFPYGKLADRLINVNDVSYMINDLDEDSVVYPDNHSIPFSSALPIAISEPTLPVPIDHTTPNVGTNTLFSFTYRIPDVIKKVVTQEWDTALVRWHKMARVQ